MGNCLKTQLKESVNNDNLEILGVLTIDVEQSDDSNYDGLMKLKPKVGKTLHVWSNNGTFAINGGTFTNDAMISNTSADTIIEFANTNSKVYISKIEDIYFISSSTLKLKRFGFKVDYLFNLDYVSLTGFKTKGNWNSTANFSRYAVISTTADNSINQEDVLNIDTVKWPNATEIRKYSNVFGDITNLADCINLTTLAIFTNPKVYGEIYDLCNAMAQASTTHVARTSGILEFSGGIGSAVTVNGEQFKSTKRARFGSSMVDPTEQETAQGWQVS